jgi:hypothetical protein
MAAAEPAGPAPSTTTSKSSSRCATADAVAGASGAAVRTSIPARTARRQLSIRLPSIHSAHCWHTPIAQNSVREGGCAPLRSLLQWRTPAAHSAAATLSPSWAPISRPSKVKRTRGPRATPAIRRSTEVTEEHER